MGFLWVTGFSFFHCVASPFHSFVTTLGSAHDLVLDDLLRVLPRPTLESCQPYSTHRVVSALDTAAVYVSSAAVRSDPRLKSHSALSCYARAQESSIMSDRFILERKKKPG